HHVTRRRIVVGMPGMPARRPTAEKAVREIEPGWIARHVRGGEQPLEADRVAIEPSLEVMLAQPVSDLGHERVVEDDHAPLLFICLSHNHGDDFTARAIDTGAQPVTDTRHLVTSFGVIIYDQASRWGRGGTVSIAKQSTSDG